MNEMKEMLFFKPLDGDKTLNLLLRAQFDSSESRLYMVV